MTSSLPSNGQGVFGTQLVEQSKLNREQLLSLFHDEACAIAMRRPDDHLLVWHEPYAQLRDAVYEYYEEPVGPRRLIAFAGIAAAASLCVGWPVAIPADGAIGKGVFACALFAIAAGCELLSAWAEKKAVGRAVDKLVDEYRKDPHRPIPTIRATGFYREPHTSAIPS